MTPEENSDGDVSLRGLNRDAFASRINVLISEAGTISALARTCGFSESVVRKWRDKKSDPKMQHLVALSRGTRTNIEWLVTGEGPMRLGELQARKAPAVYGAANTAMLAEIIETVEDFLRDQGLDLQPTKKAELITVLYDYFQAKGRVERSETARFLKLVE